MQLQAGLKVEEIAAKWNCTARDYPRDACIHELFEEQAEFRRDSTAVRFEDQKLTYGELNARSNQLARYLRARGVGPDVLVGLCVERSLDMVVGLLGILKAGGAYVPIDPGYPSDRIAYIMTNASAPVLLTQHGLTGILPEQGAQILVDGDWDRIAREEAGNLGRTSEANNLAYVIYTSGSTGLPKGVEVQHRSVVNFLCSMQEEPGITPDDVLAAVTTICFDIAGLEIYLPLVTGASTVVVGRKETADGSKLQARLRQAGATIMQATPATWRMLLDAGWQGDKKLKILCGGEALPRELANKLLPRCHSLWNMYGPTETTIWSAAYRVTAGEEATVPIGHPIANTQFYVVNDRLEQVPVGQDGELLIGGDGLARGYRKHPDLTKEKFIPDHFRLVPGARLYKTGDLVRSLPDASITFLGRLDHQVKIRGYRIELGEVEAVLARHSGVRQCIVAAREMDGEKILVAYLVFRGDRVAGRILREFLQTKLPDYMLPAAFVVVDALPLTDNGKIDRKKLPAPTRENSAMETAFAPPTDELERRLVAIWESVLKIRPIGIQDNIFELGVDSLRAAELFARVEKSMGRHLPPAPLFQAPTVASLAALLRQNEPKQKWTSLVSIQPEGSRAPLFCVHGAAGTVFGFRDLARRLAPNRPVYGLQARGLYGRDLPNTTVEAMASHYLNEIRTLQPHGPYLLGGWCFGGLVAFEMAQQLHRDGEAVQLLALFNAPSSAEYNAVRPARPGKNRPSLLRRMRQSLRARVNAATGPLKSWFRQHVYRFYVERRRPLPESMRRRYFFRVHDLAEREYVLKEYPGSALVFRDQDNYPDPYLGWKRFVKGVIEVHEIGVRENRHRALMEEPAAAVVAEKLEAFLSETGKAEPEQQTTPSNGVRLNIVEKLESNVVQ